MLQVIHSSNAGLQVQT